jgi:cobalt/nickel transport system ATP-binding protein
MADASPLLQVDALHVRYADDVAALRGVSLNVMPSERVGLIGPNGAGKTTLMLSIMNAVRFTGRIAVDGVEVRRRRSTKREAVAA